MHDVAIAKEIIKKAKELGATKGIHLEVGELAEFPADELVENIKNITCWDIKVDAKDSKVQCGCGYEGRAQILEKGHGFCFFNCPKCGGKPVVMEGGEIKIIGVA